MRSTILGLVLAIAACSAAPASPLAPPTRTSSVAVPRPVVVAAGDLDGDGRLDLVSLSTDGPELSVRLQRGLIWVTPPGPPASAALTPHLLELSDLDGDRRLDAIATAHDSGRVWIWRGDGTGGFTAAPGSPFAALAVAHPHNHGLVVGDLDRDGDADVVVADQVAEVVTVLLGDGRGGLRALAPVALGGQPYPPALGDLDGDGVLDLVAPLLDRQALAILRGDGRGGFAAVAGSPHRTARARPYAVALGDLDRDGRLDVVATHDDSDDVSVLLGDGHGGLRAAPDGPLRLGRRVWRPLLVDLDGDGLLDLVGAGGGALVTARGRPGARFAPARAEPLDGWTVLAADLDADGRVDLAAPDTAAGQIRLWLDASRL